MRNNRKPYRAPVLKSQTQDLIVRGTAHQIRDKFLVLAEETNDNVLKETYRQQAEHYGRVINA